MQVFTIRNRKPRCIYGLMELVALPVLCMEFMQQFMLHRVMRRPDLRLQQIVSLLLKVWMFKKQFPCIREGRIIFTGGMGIQIFQ